MNQYTTNELFDLLTIGDEWYEGLYNYNYARQIKKRHRDGTLGIVVYEEIFTHFGYIKFWKKS